MEILLLVVCGGVCLLLGVGLFASMTDPREVDAEEEREVIKEKRRWWSRRG